jgi:hypothetical protein
VKVKGRAWCADLPVVMVSVSAEPKPLTIIYPYYCNPEFLRQQVARWSTFHPLLRQHLSAIVVDDGSPEPAEDVLRGLDQPFPIRLFRIGVDVRWNWLAARNIGFHHAPEGWCLVTDMDHVIPETTATSVVYGQHDPGVIYGFSRIESTGEPVAAHPNSWLLTRQMFWRVGGYDETLSGHYGTDGDWRRRCHETAPMHILTDRLVRHEYQGDSSTRAYQRKQPQDRRVSELIAARGKRWTPKTLSFPYNEIALVGALA